MTEPTFQRPGWDIELADPPCRCRAMCLGPEVAEHPDTGAMRAMTGAQEGKAFPGGADEPYFDVVIRVMHAAGERGRARRELP